jgi:peptidyl-prolyl cis-trans isomerase SurA
VSGAVRFDSLARSESDDPRSASRGGELGTLRPGQNVPPAFRDAAFGIEEVGGISDVVRTRFGYHILKLLERKERPSFETAYESIEQRVRQMPRMDRRMSVVADEILARQTVSVDTTAILAAAYPNAGRSALDSLAHPLARLTQDTDVDAVVATVGSTERTREDLAAFLQSNQEARRRPIRDALTDFMQDTALDVAAQDLETSDPSFRRKMQEYRDGLLLFEYMQREVWTPAAQDAAALRTFFEENRDDYRYPERVRTVRLAAPHDSLLAPYADAAAEGGSAQDIAAQAENDSLVSGTTMYVSEDTPSPASLVLQLADGGSVGPVALDDNSERALFIRQAAEAPRPMTFEEARSRVIRDFQDQYEEDVLDELASRYAVETYPANLPDPSR